MRKYIVELANRIERGRAVGNLWGVAEYVGGRRTGWVLNPQPDAGTAYSFAADHDAQALAEIRRHLTIEAVIIAGVVAYRPHLPEVPIAVTLLALAAAIQYTLMLPSGDIAGIECTVATTDQSATVTAGNFAERVRRRLSDVNLTRRTAAVLMALAAPAIEDAIDRMKITNR